MHMLKALVVLSQGTPREGRGCPSAVIPRLRHCFWQDSSLLIWDAIILHFLLVGRKFVIRIT